MWKFGNLWAGDQGSYELALTAVASAMALQATEAAPKSDLLTIEGGVGIITIEGGMIPGHAGFFSFFGLVGYDDIREAAIEAAMNPEVKSILLNIDSGGGAVSGCADCASLLAQVGERKPMVTYSGGAIGSAAYWIGSQSQSVLVGSTAQVGSIGVIMKHSEATKMYEKDGITHTVIRAGEYKQLANSVEVLSPEAKAQLQQMADDIKAVFDADVATARGTTVAALKSKMGEGREFIGARAVSVGLADAIATYEGAISVARALQAVDNTLPARQNAAQRTGANMSKKSLLSAEQIAALASGAGQAVDTASAAQETAEDTATVAAAAAAAAAETAADKTKTPEEIAEATAAAAAATETAAAAAATAGTAAAAAVTAETELVKFLRTELSTANATILANGIKIAGLEAEAATVKDTQPKLLEIARAAVGNMKVALGGTATAAAGMTALEVIAAHAETSDTFAKKFVVGGAAASSMSTEKPEQRQAVAAPNILFLAAARSSGNK